MAPLHKVAVIQLQPKDVALEENFAKAEAYIREAAAQGADLAVLPEYHLTSWCPEHPDFVASCVTSAPYLARYQSLARALAINIVPGTICEVLPSPSASSKPEIRNMTYWITPTGALAGTYQKKNLWHPERPHLTPGVHKPHAAFDTPLALGARPLRAGLLVCWDLFFPEAFRALLADGADLVVRVFLEAAVVTRAYENVCAVVFCNAGGLSQVAVPVDFGVLEVAEGVYKVREDMRGRGGSHVHVKGQRLLANTTIPRFSQ
ncbi:carbon-nitrogen hydrolase [Lasiosphaeris hirsuta]|uniref:Carbon-nitrogen hydrolase n=1 Tax=Lasiosphaeris hirsuta TaxID=260670 RepID=A0AA40DKW8_9PEZI|nr:carbon-nitrogen hydrolase [Lasiosphaeris hirsuta]